MTKTDLTRNQSLVFNALVESDGPLSAYTLLDRLREHGFRAPLQVYRALDKLVEFGMVHRLESLNAFVACAHPHDGCSGHGTVAFMICNTCGHVTSFTIMTSTIGSAPWRAASGSSRKRRQSR